MKKIMLTMMFSCLLAGGVLAQKNLTTAQKNFQNSIISFLKEEGYSPALDEDNWIKFKSEGKSHYIAIQKESPFFVIFRIAGFTLGENAFKLLPALFACNDVNAEDESVKLYCEKSMVTVQIEQYTRSAEDFKYVFAKNLSRLAAARQKFITKYDEYEEAVK